MRNKFITHFICSGSLLLLFATSLEAVEAKLIWSIESTFRMPESAVYDAQRQAVYLSNVNHYAKDSNGFISRISGNGENVQLEWITGLHSPTGLAIKNEMLYAVDYDALVVIDLRSEKIISRIPAIDATEKPGLNDVTVADNGDIYVSGSSSRSIYKVTGNVLDVWLKDEVQLKNANGLLVYGDVLLHGGQSWTAYDRKSKESLQNLTQMGQGIKNIDGITRYGQQGFLVSLLDDARLWLLREGQLPVPFSETSIDGIDMHYVPENKRLYIPRAGNTVSVYKLATD